MTDYLAIVLIGTGSSWARDADKEKAIKRVAKITAKDWSSLFDLKGKPGKVNVWDVTGSDSVWWDAEGVHTDGPEAKLLEVREVTL